MAVSGQPPCVDSELSSDISGSQSQYSAESFAWIYFFNSHSASLEKGGLAPLHRRNRFEEGRQIVQDRLAEIGKLAPELPPVAFSLCNGTLGFSCQRDIEFAF